MKTTNAFAFILLVLCCTSAESAAPIFNIAPLGFNDVEHTRNDGYKFSGVGELHEEGEPAQLNEAGQVRGYSERYNGGSTWLGYSAWLYDGATTIKIGLTGSEHTRNDGYKYSFPYELNEAGQVRGYSSRYNGGSTDLGWDAWLYDPVLEQSFSLQLSSRSDGYALSTPAYLGEDGL